jgi:hypothetical protein
MHTFILLSNKDFFFGNSSDSWKIFTLQKKIVRIMVGAQPRTSCKRVFKQPETLPNQFQYILSLISFIINNLDIFQTNLSTHNINMRNKHHHLHRPNANHFVFQKRTFYVGIKIFNNLPPSVTIIKNGKALKAALTKYLHKHSFYLLIYLLHGAQSFLRS